MNIDEFAERIDKVSDKGSRIAIAIVRTGGNYEEPSAWEVTVFGPHQVTHRSASPDLKIAIDEALKELADREEAARRERQSNG